ncbi:MAG: calcium-binding protein, partial [Pirellulales bacterium]
MLDSSTSDVEFKITGSVSQSIVGSGLDFNAGLSSLGLNLQPDNGGVRLQAGYGLTLEFGVDTTGGFYVVPSVSSLTLGASAGLDSGLANRPFTATGSLGPLQLSATDGTSQGNSGLTANFAVSLGNAPSGTNLYLPELSELNPQVSLSGGAGIHLHLALGIGDNGPSISTDFDFGWSFDTSSNTPWPITSDTGEDIGSTAPTIAFNNITINVGSFVENLIGPFFNEVNQVLAPIEPILSILTTDLPILSDFGIDVNLLDLARAFGYGDAADFIQTAADVVNVIHDIASIGAAGGYNLGSYSVNVDARTASDLGTSTTETAPPATDPADSSAKADLTGLSSNSDDASGQPILQFPFLSNPASLVGLLLGQNVNLMTFNMPSLDIGFHWSTGIPIFPPFLNAEFGGGFNVHLQLGFGFDTEGFFTGNPLDGLYIDDTAPQVSLTGSLTVGAEVSLVIVTAGVDGGIFANINMQLNDPNRDGKVRLSEIEQEGAACLFDESGSIYAGLQAYVHVGIDLGLFSITLFAATVNIADITLLDFNHSCPPAPPPQPVLGTMELGGVLALNMGPLAHNRIIGDVKDDNENFTVNGVPGHPDWVNVTAFGVTDTYTGVTSVEADGGLGNNTITIGSNLALPVHIVGGSGHGSDTIVDHGTGAAYLAGGGSGGDSMVYTGPGPATLYGGSGNDTLDASGSTGNVSIYGKGGDDTLLGGSGNDLLQAGRGNASLVSGSGVHAASTLIGGTGNDTLIGA